MRPICRDHRMELGSRVSVSSGCESSALEGVGPGGCADLEE
jgi:hypothetical protein